MAPQLKPGGEVAPDRLGRIEDKLDKLSEAVVGLARMEERMITLFRRMDKYDGALEKIVQRLDELEKSMTKGGVVARFADKLFWVILGGAVAWIVKTGGGV